MGFYLLSTFCPVLSCPVLSCSKFIKKHWNGVIIIMTSLRYHVLCNDVNFQTSWVLWWSATTLWNSTEGQRDFRHVGWYLHCKQAKFFVNVMQHGDGNVACTPHIHNCPADFKQFRAYLSIHMVLGGLNCLRLSKMNPSLKGGMA
jgi:hypothetical protein